jgi:hypothetical protein
MSATDGREHTFQAALKSEVERRQKQQEAEQRRNDRYQREQEEQDALDKAWRDISRLATWPPTPGEDLGSVDGYCDAYAARFRRLGRVLNDQGLMEPIRCWQLPEDIADTAPGLVLARELVCLGGDRNVPESVIAERICSILNQPVDLLREMQNLFFEAVRRQELPPFLGTQKTKDQEASTAIATQTNVVSTPQPVEEQPSATACENAAQVKRDDEKEPSPADAATAPAIDRESLAIAVLYKQPTLSLPQIAEKVGVSRQTLYKWPKFLQAAEAVGKYSQKKPCNRGRLPHGSRSADGSIEAWREAEDE